VKDIPASARRRRRRCRIKQLRVRCGDGRSLNLTGFLPELRRYSSTKRTCSENFGTASVWILTPCSRSSDHVALISSRKTAGDGAFEGGGSYKNAPTKSVSVGGTRFVYREPGIDSGVPVIFVNHLATNLDNWDPRVVDGIAASTAHYFDFGSFWRARDSSAWPTSSTSSSCPVRRDEVFLE
jgi:hypothetical protein